LQLRLCGDGSRPPQRHPHTGLAATKNQLHSVPAGPIVVDKWLKPFFEEQFRDTVGIALSDKFAKSYSVARHALTWEFS
jgi:hypothetical protein